MRSRGLVVVLATLGSSASAKAAPTCPGAVAPFGPSCSIVSPLAFGPPTVGPFTIDILGCPQAGATVTLEMQSTWTYATHAMGGISLVLVSATPAPPGATINGCDILVGASAPWVLPNDDLWKVPCPVGTAASCF